MKQRYRKPSGCWMVLVASVCAASAAAGDDRPAPNADVRRTATVQLVERALPATVTLQSVFRRDDRSLRVSSGSGFVIDRRGYVLTNSHVVPDGALRRIVTLSSGRSAEFEIVARYPFTDIALVKIPGHPSLGRLRIGRSHDLMLGEPTIVIGSPDGLTSTVSTGIISGLRRGTSMAALGPSGLVQTSAPSGHGGSGGPLMNAMGDVIGVISSGRDHVDNVTFAIPADRIRLSFPEMLAAEARFGIHLGLSVDMLADVAVVTAVDSDSPAAVSGLRPEDVITRVGGRQVRYGLDFWLALTEAVPGDTLTIHVERAAGPEIFDVKLGRHQPWPAITDPGPVISGLNVSVYEGLWETLPDFEQLDAVETAVSPRVELDVTDRREHMGLVFDGYLRIPEDGLYLFGLTSDDGSRLIIDGQVVVDLDGPHPAIEHGTQISLASGLHRFRVEFFEAEGHEVLEVSVQSDRMKSQPLPPDWLFHRKP